MNHELLIRLAWALSFVGAGMLLYRLANRLVLERARAQSLSSSLFASGRPAILYFTTPTCAPCKTVQRPAIDRLQEKMGDTLQVVEIDASVKPELADQWGVLSVPTTFIIDAKGLPRHVNHGVATADELWHQIQNLS